MTKCAHPVAHQPRRDGVPWCSCCNSVPEGVQSIEEPPKKRGEPPPPSLGECSTAGCGDPSPALPREAIRVEAPDPLYEWPAFVAAARVRLDEGRVTYGDRSFGRLSSELIAELQQEALDLADWGYILWRRLENARKAAKRMETEAERMGGKE